MYLDDDYSPRCNEGDALLDRLFGDSDMEYGDRGCTCRQDGCGTGAFDTSWGLRDKPLAMVYSVLQDFDGLYDKDKALTRGTLFEKLDLPFEGGMSGASCGICGGVRND